MLEYKLHEKFLFTIFYIKPERNDIIYYKLTYFFKNCVSRFYIKIFKYIIAVCPFIKYKT